MIPERFERSTHALEGRCSIQLSYGTILNCAAKVHIILILPNIVAKFCRENLKGFPNSWGVITFVPNNVLI